MMRTSIARQFTRRILSHRHFTTTFRPSKYYLPSRSNGDHEDPGPSEPPEPPSDQTVLQILRNAATNNTHPPPSPTESPLSSEVRLAMRRLAYPVAVVHSTPLSSSTSTSTSTSTPPSPSPSSGLLVTSFNTITLTPTPLVSFNIKLPSRTYNAISSSSTFTVSPLWDPHAARHFSNYYAKGAPWRFQKSPMDEFGSWLEERRVWGLECEWLRDKSVEVGDHVLMVGKGKRWLPGLVTASGRKTLVYEGQKLRVVGHSADFLLKREREGERRAGEVERVIGGGAERGGRRGGEERERNGDVEGRGGGGADRR
ncbi:MAG: hypothetical protein MMC23_001047 [Stictis urceolatum]|nr:hypothetical protein [Stictis urceolata]